MYAKNSPKRRKGYTVAEVFAKPSAWLRPIARPAGTVTGRTTYRAADYGTQERNAVPAPGPFAQVTARAKAREAAAEIARAGELAGLALKRSLAAKKAAATRAANKAKAAADTVTVRTPAGPLKQRRDTLP